jgi:16S rRNA (cytosine967-C5)-methyltransferase
LITRAEKFYQPYPARVEGVARILDAVMGKKEYADKALERYFKANKKAGSDDRAFISEMVYDAVRHWNYLVWFTGDKFSFKRDGLWLLVGNLLFLKGYELPEWQEFAPINKAKAAERANRKNMPRHIMQSVSMELDELAVEQACEERWNQELLAMNTPASVVLRANTLQITKQKLADVLSSDGIETNTLPDYEDALQLVQRTNIFRHPLFVEGAFEIQDAGSQKIAPFLQVEPGMRVVDACAGAGGKTLHLASLMENKGRIIAMDVENFKLDELKNRALRNGVNIIETRLIDGMKTIKRLEGSADRLLLDVPCTGSGVLKRNPDAKYKIDRPFFKRVTAIQKEIIEEYSRMLKPGGMMVYATCSIFKGENEQQVSEFLEKNTNFVLEEQYMHYPSETGFDGFFMARIKRVD